jgi:N,N'-diacetyllegionaminate synthase
MTDTLNREVTIRGRKVSDAEPLYIVGEIACGHQGDVEQCKRLIDAAVDAGADAVQLEFFYPPANMVGSLEFYKLVESLAFTREQWADLMVYARKFDIAVSVFVYDDVSMNWALSMKPDMLKLNSSDISNPDLIIAAAKSGLPFTVGTGASTFQEVEDAVTLALEHGGRNLILQHGVQNFPTPSENAHIRRIALLKDAFGGLVMYADHTDASLPLAHHLDLTAVGMGACMVEKHMVLDRAAKGVDWQAALEPAELKAYVATMRAGSKALGPDRLLPPSEGDERYRRFQKKSIVAAHDIPAGAKISRSDVSFLRAQGAADGLSPMKFKSIAGLATTRAIAKWEQITMANLKGDA